MKILSLCRPLEFWSEKHQGWYTPAGFISKASVDFIRRPWFAVSLDAGLDASSSSAVSSDSVPSK